MNQEGLRKPRWKSQWYLLSVGISYPLPQLSLVSQVSRFPV